MGKSIASVVKPVAKASAMVAASPAGLAGGLLAGKASDKALGMIPGLNISDEGEQGAFNDQADLQSYLRQTDANVDPIGGMKIAQNQVQSNPLLAGLYGKGGLQEQLGSEQNRLSTQGFQLTPEDREAYGQASGDISRQFGQQEQDLSKSLARRGLASAGSGAAGAGFSGLAGNKNEMLAKAQTQIANDRMNNTMQRLAQTRSQMQSLGMQGQDAAQQQYANQVGSRSNRINELGMLEQSKSGVIGDKAAAYKPSMFETLKQGLQTGIGNLGAQAPGMAVGGLTGGLAGGAASAAKPQPGLSGSNNQNYRNYA